MKFPVQVRRVSAARVLCLAIGGLLAGCEEPAEIRVQDAPKQVIEPAEFAGLSEQPHTILAAMVPRDVDVWVFRLDGPTQDVQSQRDAFESFVASLSLDGGDSRPHWELPPGWEEVPASASSLRQASIRVPTEDGTALDLSVSRLPAREDWLHYQLRNYNRWRRQLQLPVAGADELAEASQEVALEDAADMTAAIVAISGKFADRDAGPMTPHSVLPSSPTPGETISGPQEPEFTYDAPQEWDAGPSSSVRRASFVVSEGGRQATIAVTAFPIGNSQMADPLANINRWREQVGLAPITRDQVGDNTESIEIDGLQGLYVAADGSDAGTGRAIHAAMVERGDLAWFFKLDGSQELVEREVGRFREFLQSVDFADE